VSTAPRQIEKEALAVTWASEQFQTYMLGIQFQIQTDHKPPVPLFSSKPLELFPVRVQCFRLRMMHFDFTISHIPGKELYFADTLSRSPFFLRNTRLVIPRSLQDGIWKELHSMYNQM